MNILEINRVQQLLKILTETYLKINAVSSSAIYKL